MPQAKPNDSTFKQMALDGMVLFLSWMDDASTLTQDQSIRLKSSGGPAYVDFVPRISMQPAPAGHPEATVNFDGLTLPAVLS